MFCFLKEPERKRLVWPLLRSVLKPESRGFPTLDAQLPSGALSSTVFGEGFPCKVKQPKRRMLPMEIHWAFVDGIHQPKGALIPVIAFGCIAWQFVVPSTVLDMAHQESWDPPFFRSGCRMSSRRKVILKWFKTHERYFFAYMVYGAIQRDPQTNHIDMFPCLRFVFGSVHTPQRIFLRHEAGCLLAQWRWLLHRSLTVVVRQRAEGCGAAAFQASLEAHCDRPAARFDSHAVRGRVARWGLCSLANWLPQAARSLGMASRWRL